MKCSRCGVESNIAGAFLVRKHLGGWITRAYCPACRESEFLRGQLMSVAAAALLLGGLDALTLGRGLQRLLLDFAFLFLVNIPLLAAHELAHAAAARLLGVRVFRVHFGYGRLLFSRRLFGIVWEIRLWLLGGGTLMSSPPQSRSRARLFGAVLAGPATHLLLVFLTLAFQMILLALGGWFGADVLQLYSWSRLFFIFNGIALIVNLIPVKTRVPVGQVGTDGWQLLHLALSKPAEQDARLLAYYQLEYLDASDRGDFDAASAWAERGLARFPDDPNLRNSLAVAQMKRRRFAASREIFRALLSSPEAENPVFENLMFNNVAYSDVLLKDPDLLPEADDYSRKALSQLGWEPSIIGTRGAVLIELGRLEEGIALLKKALARHSDAFSRAADAYHLAVGESRRGNAAGSRKYLEMARRWDPKFFLLEDA
jgi:tetratricopeptide (TPR) repeat protein